MISNRNVVAITTVAAMEAGALPSERKVIEGEPKQCILRCVYSLDKTHYNIACQKAGIAGCETLLEALSAIGGDQDTPQGRLAALEHWMKENELKDVDISKFASALKAEVIWMRGVSYKDRYMARIAQQALGEYRKADELIKAENSKRSKLCAEYYAWKDNWQLTKKLEENDLIKRCKEWITGNRIDPKVEHDKIGWWQKKRYDYDSSWEPQHWDAARRSVILDNVIGNYARGCDREKFKDLVKGCALSNKWHPMKAGDIMMWEKTYNCKTLNEMLIRFSHWTLPDQRALMLHMMEKDIKVQVATGQRGREIDYRMKQLLNLDQQILRHFRKVQELRVWMQKNPSRTLDDANREAGKTKWTQKDWKDAEVQECKQFVKQHQKVCRAVANKKRPSQSLLETSTFRYVRTHVGNLVEPAATSEEYVYGKNFSEEAWKAAVFEEAVDMLITGKRPLKKKLQELKQELKLEGAVDEAVKKRIQKQIQEVEKELIPKRLTTGAIPLSEKNEIEEEINDNDMWKSGMSVKKLMNRYATDYRPCYNFDEKPTAKDLEIVERK